MSHYLFERPARERGGQVERVRSERGPVPGRLVCVRAERGGRAGVDRRTALAVVVVMHLIMERAAGTRASGGRGGHLRWAPCRNADGAGGLDSLRGRPLVDGIAPYWMVVLWMSFATTLNDSLRGLTAKGALAAAARRTRRTAGYYAVSVWAPCAWFIGRLAGRVWAGVAIALAPAGWPRGGRRTSDDERREAGSPHCPPSRRSA